MCEEKMSRGKKEKIGLLLIFLSYEGQRTIN